MTAYPANVPQSPESPLIAPVQRHHFIASLSFDGQDLPLGCYRRIPAMQGGYRHVPLEHGSGFRVPGPLVFRGTVLCTVCAN